jgi:hypothetical protein
MAMREHICFRERHHLINSCTFYLCSVAKRLRAPLRLCHRLSELQKEQTVGLSGLLTAAAVQTPFHFEPSSLLYKADRSYQTWGARFEKNKSPILRQ